MVDYRLYSLIKVVENGSYVKAAKQLALSQPAVSQHIRQIEETLGIRIFEHAHNRIALTKEGELVVKYARRMIALSDRLKTELKDEREKVRSLTVGMTHSAESNFIVEALAAYTAERPDLKMKILSFTMDQLYNSLRNYELDFGFVEGKTGDASFSYTMLDTDCLVLAVPPGHRLAARSTVTIAQLKTERLILRLPQSNTRVLFEAALESNGFRLSDFNVSMEIDCIQTILDLVCGGFGVSVLAKSACMNEVKNGKLAVLSVENLSMVREINLVCLKDYEHPELLRGIVKQYNEMQRKRTGLLHSPRKGTQPGPAGPFFAEIVPGPAGPLFVENYPGPAGPFFTENYPGLTSPLLVENYPGPAGPFFTENRPLACFPGAQNPPDNFPGPRNPLACFPGAQNPPDSFPGPHSPLAQFPGAQNPTKPPWNY